MENPLRKQLEELLIKQGNADLSLDKPKRTMIEVLIRLLLNKTIISYLEKHISAEKEMIESLLA